MKTSKNLKYILCLFSIILITFIISTDFTFSKDNNIMYSVDEGNLEEIKQALDKGLDINSKINQNGWTMLMRAALATKKNEETFKFLLDNGADISTKANDGRTVLSFAVEGNNIQIIQMLIDKGINFKCIESYEAFIYSVKRNCQNIVELFIKNGIDVNCTDKSGLTALMSIAFYGNRIESMKFLIKNGINVNAGHPNGGLTSLMIAAECNHTSEIKLLIESGADVNAKTTKGINALDIAIEMKKTAAVEILKKYGAFTAYEKKINKPSIKFSTIEKFEIDSQANELMKAAFNKDYITVETLFKAYRMRLDDVDRLGRTALIYAIAGGNYEVIKLLALEYTSSGCERDNNYMSPIFYAVIHNNVKAAKKLLKLAGCKHVRGDGMSPMKLAVELERNEIVELFKKFEITRKNWIDDIYFNPGSQVDSCYSFNHRELMDDIKKDDIDSIKKHISYNKNADTLEVYKEALLHASSEGDIEAVDHLIKKGINVNSYSMMYDKTSPLMVACTNNRYNMAKYLIEHGANINYENHFKKDAMYKLTFEAKSNFFDLFIKNGFNINKKYKNGKTLLMMICKNLNKESFFYSDYMKTTKVLLINHADPNIKKDDLSDGETALMMALENENNDLVKLLIEYGANINETDSVGLTPLMIASEKGNLESIKILINSQAPINVCDADGETAIFRAVARGHNDIVKYFIKNKADLKIINHNGQTVLKTALKYKNFEAAKIIELNGEKE